MSMDSLNLLKLIPYLISNRLLSYNHAVSSLEDDSRPRYPKPSSYTVTSDDTENSSSSIPEYMRSTGNTKRSKLTTSNAHKRCRLSKGQRAVPHDPRSYMPDMSTARSSNAHTATLSDAQESRGMDHQARSMYGEDNETGYPPYTSIWTPD